MGKPVSRCAGIPPLSAPWTLVPMTCGPGNLFSVVGNHSYPGLVGIDLLANETHTPALETGQKIYIPILAANQGGTINIHRTMHAGELGLVHNVRDAMIMGAERVGHGVLLARDPLALEYAVQEKNFPSR